MTKTIYFGPYYEMSSGGGVGDNILKMRMLQVKKHPHSKMILSNSTLPDEIPHQRRLRYLLVGHRNEVMQEFHEPVRLAVFRTILRHRRQNPLRMASQHRELHQIC